MVREFNTGVNMPEESAFIAAETRMYRLEGLVMGVPKLLLLGLDQPDQLTPSGEDWVCTCMEHPPAGKSCDQDSVPWLSGMAVSVRETPVQGLRHREVMKA